MSSVCYILNSFPRPSETFISDEAESMAAFGIKSYILYLADGDSTVIHPSSRKIIELKLAQKINYVTKKESLRTAFKLSAVNPKGTLTCLLQVIKKNKINCWHYFQATPYAYFLYLMNVRFIHCHFGSENLIWAKILSNWSGIPFGVTTHGYDLRDDPISFQDARKLYSEANLVVTISNYNKNLMVKKYGLPPDKIKVIHSGIDTELFKHRKAIIKFTDPSLNLINVGRLVPEKGQDILLKALAEVRKNYVQFRLKIIGAGPLIDDLKELARSLDLHNHVDFLEAQPQEIVIEMLQEADIFILSSRTEGLPVVCMEAMAMEVFLIASRISGIPELVDDKINGLLVDPEDVPGLAEAVCWADNNRKLLPEMCFNARRRVEKDFNRLKCTKKLLSEMNLKANRDIL